MLSIKVGKEQFEVPYNIIQLKPFDAPVLLGVDFSHFFNLVISTRLHIYDTLVETAEAVHAELEKFAMFLNSMKIKPVFVMPGITSLPFSNYMTYIMHLSEKQIKSFGYDIIYAPSYETSQLGYFIQHNYINAAFSTACIALQDVPHWIHYFDYSSCRAIVCHATSHLIVKMLSGEFGVNIGFPHLFAPRMALHSIEWRIAHPYTQIKCSLQPISLLSTGLVRPPRIFFKLSSTINERTLIAVPAKSQPYFTKLATIYTTIFRNMTKIHLSRLNGSQFDPGFDNFLPLILMQNPMQMSCTQAEPRLFSQILAAQNMQARSFTTLFECLKSFSPPEKPKIIGSLEDTVLTESTRRFLTALEYVAPGGGLSPWGRAALMANSNDEISIFLFIELIRADVMDASLEAHEAQGVGVTDVIERIFLLHPIETKFKRISKTEDFSAVVDVLGLHINAILSEIMCDTYLATAGEEANMQTLKSIISKMKQAQHMTNNSSGYLMRFLLESSEEKIREFSEGVEDRKQLRKDVKGALSWWGCLRRAMKELKQRSLKPNARVSNLMNFLVMFECADEFIQKRSDTIMRNI